MGTWNKLLYIIIIHSSEHFISFFTKKKKDSVCSEVAVLVKLNILTHVMSVITLGHISSHLVAAANYQIIPSLTQKKVHFTWGSVSGVNATMFGGLVGSWSPTANLINLSVTEKAWECCRQRGDLVKLLHPTSPHLHYTERDLKMSVCIIIKSLTSHFFTPICTLWLCRALKVNADFAIHNKSLWYYI